MIECKECVDFLSDYVDGYLKEDVLEKLESHLSDCPPCQDFMQTFKSTVSMTQELKAEEVPDAVILKLRSFIRKQMGANHIEENFSL
jgi:anti-sigma factor RsiW